MSLATLGVADLAVAREFYVGLGWQDVTPDANKHEIVFLSDGGPVRLALWHRHLLAEDSGVANDHGGWGGVTLAFNYPDRETVDKMLERAVELGGSVVRPAKSAEWGGYSGVFADPDGNRWEIAFPLLELE